MSIPTLEFKPRDGGVSPIEIIDLTELSQRDSIVGMDPEKSHRMNFSMLLFIEQGNGTHFVDFVDYGFNAGSLIFVNKNQVHSFDFSNQPIGKAVLFTDEFVKQIQSNMKISIFYSNNFNKNYSPIIQSNDDLRVSCKNILNEIQSELSKPETDSMVIMLLFSSLFLKIEKQRNHVECTNLQSQEYQRMNQFLALLESDFTKTRNASDYAEKLSISYKSLNNLCKKASGQTVKQIIDSYIILEAKRRLLLGGRQVKELAFELGFDEVTNFTKFFKKHTLLPPSHFKKT